ncbi:MAG TPA: PAS domain S-box protein [Pyrinomonadaceae bacterium]|nr:PAS domain S-box protein [Pyrinomonadaceae bacterium]
MIAQTSQQGQRKKDPYKRLAEINRAITTSLDFDRVLNLIVENAAQLVDASACMLLLADSEHRMRIHASRGIDSNLAASFSGAIEEDLIKSLQDLIPPSAAGPMISVPIIAKQALNGLLVISREGALSEEEEWQLSALADQAAIALRNARLYEMELAEANRERDATMEALQASNARTTRILESITDLFYQLDLEWRFTNVNRQTELRLGVPRDQMIGRVFWEVFPHAVDSMLYQRFHQAMETMEPAHFEVPLGIIPGAWFEAHAYPSRSGLTVYLREITERKRAERTSRLLASIVESSDDAIISKDLNGIVSSWNRGAERVFGYKADEVIGKSITILIPDELYDEEEAILNRIRSGRSVDHYETVRQRKDGTLINISLTISPIRDESGRVIGASKIARDITDEKRALEEKARLLEREQVAREEAETANRLKDEFLATLSHELRNPLNVVIGYSEILRRSDDVNSQFVNRAAEVIRRNALAQSQLVSDLLDLSRLQMGKLAINQQPVSLLTILTDALETVKAEVHAKQITIKLNASQDPFMVDGDPVRLGQIAWNLLNNAVKFTGPGGAITISLEHQGTGAEIVVEDTGQGIAPEFLPCVFEIFRQGDASSSRRQGGLGIGLALVKQLAELHGGMVRAESEGVGRGAKFSVWMPLRDVEATTPASISNVATGELEGTCILVVDDSDETTMMLAKLLEMDGAEVHTAHGGVEALALAEKSKFDLIISDISMPEMDGYQLLQELRRLPMMANVPALALTGFGRVSDVDRAHRVGFSKHFTKPLDIDKLLVTVRELTRHNGTKIAPQSS